MFFSLATPFPRNSTHQSQGVNFSESNIEYGKALLGVSESKWCRKKFAITCHKKRAATLGAIIPFQLFPKITLFHFFDFTMKMSTPWDIEERICSIFEKFFKRDFWRIEQLFWTLDARSFVLTTDVDDMYQIESILRHVLISGSKIKFLTFSLILSRVPPDPQWSLWYAHELACSMTSWEKT